MGKVKWSPRCERPDQVVPPLRVGEYGLTRAEARNGKKWRRVASGWYVPARVDGEVVEQRIVEQALRVEDCGAITGWASLRWQGAAFFDGTTDGGRTRLPIPLRVYPHLNMRSTPAASISREWCRSTEFEWIDGIWCLSAERSVFDEVRRTRSLAAGVIAVDMAAAAGLASVSQMREYVDGCRSRIGVPHVRRVLALASDDSRSPQETRLRLVWVVDAGLPDPLCNQPVFALDGSFLGMPDLFDPVAGVVGEYDGAHHLEDDQRRADREREELFRDHGLEYFAVVKGELGNRERVSQRMLATRTRALWLPPERRAWTLDQPTWWKSR